MVRSAKEEEAMVPRLRIKGKTGWTYWDKAANKDISEMAF